MVRMMSEEELRRVLAADRQYQVTKRNKRKNNVIELRRK